MAKILSYVNPDLLKERQSATFQVELLTNILDDGEHRTKRRREIQKAALEDKALCGGPDVSFLSREELYTDALRRAARVLELKKKWHLEGDEIHWFLMIAFPFETPPDYLHTMFTPTIESQSTEEQKKRWLPKVYSKEYLGTYAQTELGHGSYIRGLETTATYDVRREEFVLNSPTTTSIKWWPGGLGKTCNAAVVMAQVYSNGICRGLYPFFVQLRDPDTHQSLPGITLGDIGPKLGYNSIDNGFLLLDHVRVPRENMLMRHAEVLKDGTFQLKTQMKKPAYGVMTMIRTSIVNNTGARSLAAAVTVAIRYSAVRRQSELDPGAPEPQIIEYQTQQYKLYPYLAMAYGVWFTSLNLSRLFKEATQARGAGDESLFQELHALSSGLKAYSTEMAVAGIEQARVACGGHGYSEASGLPKMYKQCSPAKTFEGENTVLELQTARFLMKCHRQMKSGATLPRSVDYLSADDENVSDLDASMKLRSLLAAFEHRARRLIGETQEAISRLVAQGIKEHRANNLCGVRLVRCSTAHCEMFVVKSFVDFLPRVQDSAVRAVLHDLCQLMAVHTMMQNSGDFLEDGFLSRRQMQLLRDKEERLLVAIRPNGVALVDAFDFPDRYLSSILGRYDGHVYENMYKWAQKSPLNNTDVHWAHHRYMKPAIKAKI